MNRGVRFISLLSQFHGLVFHFLFLHLHLHPVSLLLLGLAEIVVLCIDIGGSLRRLFIDSIGMACSTKFVFWRLLVQ